MNYCSCQPGRCAIKENNLNPDLAAVKCLDYPGRQSWQGSNLRSWDDPIPSPKPQWKDVGPAPTFDHQRERPSSYVEQAPTWRRPRALAVAGDDRRRAQRRINAMDDERFSHPWRRSRNDRRQPQMKSGSGPEPGFAQARTAAIRVRCEANAVGGQRCLFPNCDGCGFDHLVDREVETGRPADPGFVAIREFEPDQAQLRAINAIYLAIGTSCKVPEDALALLTYALTEYIQKVSKPERYPEAVETVIRCIRFNSGITNENDQISGNVRGGKETP